MFFINSALRFELNYLKQELEKKENAEQVAVLDALKKILGKNDNDKAELDCKSFDENIKVAVEALHKLAAQSSGSDNKLFLDSLLGFCYQHGIGLIKNPETAKNFYEDALKINKDFAFALFNLGMIQCESPKPSQGDADFNTKEAIWIDLGKQGYKNIWTAADKGYAPASYWKVRIGSETDRENLPKLTPRSKFLGILGSADQGYAPAQYSAFKLKYHKFSGKLDNHKHGDLLGADSDKALKYLMAAAEQGHKAANVLLGKYYLCGESSIKSPESSPTEFIKKDLYLAAICYKKCIPHNSLEADLRNPAKSEERFYLEDALLCVEELLKDQNSGTSEKGKEMALQLCNQIASLKLDPKSSETNRAYLVVQQACDLRLKHDTEIQDFYVVNTDEFSEEGSKNSQDSKAGVFNLYKNSGSNPDARSNSNLDSKSNTNLASNSTQDSLKSFKPGNDEVKKNTASRPA